jgi:hypothetical protein
MRSGNEFRAIDARVVDGKLHLIENSVEAL